MEIIGKNKVFFGLDKKTRENIFITKPSFDCGWYWSFGYLGNKDLHYHLESYSHKEHHFILNDGTTKCITENRNINMRDALLLDYELCENIKDNLWVFCELSTTIYDLKKAAEIFHIGGSHYTENPLKTLLKREYLNTLLNETIIPKLCQELWNLIGGNE